MTGSPLCLPTEFSLGDCFPNPFQAGQSGTRIQYALPTAQHVRLEVFDVAGRRVSTLVDKPQPAGRYELVYRAPGLRSGVYFYRFEAGAFLRVGRRVVLQ